MPAGVTLLELLVVAALASVLLTLVLPSIRTGMSGLELRTSAQRVAAAAKFARDQAIFRQRPVEFEIDRASKTISVIDSGGETRSFELPAEVRFGKILPETETPVATRTFLFSPDGASPVFQIDLENARRAMTITQDPLTGFPKVSDKAAVSENQ